MKSLRSLLFIPGDSEKKLGHADDTSADALILDLEDSVTPARKALAREMILAFLRERPPGGRRSELWVRINPLESSEALPDLAAIVPAAPDGIMVPKVDGPAHLQRISHYLEALEVGARVQPGSIRLLPVATETPLAPFRLGDYATANLSRLFGLTWGAEDLSAAVGASTNLGPDGTWGFSYQMVRSMTLFAAHAAGVAAIETLYSDYRDQDGLRRSCTAARAEGFNGRIAIHPAQVSVINESFSPTPEEINFAHRVVEAFAAQPDAGTIGLDGKMLDIPHLKQARRVIAASQHMVR
jgi:citrate lyase subunit beta/citryl-CoA lyase